MLAILRAVLWTDPAIVVLTIFMGSISLLASIVDGTGRLQHRIARRWARMVMAAAGIKVTVTGVENLAPGGHYIFCSNHLSLIDTTLVFGFMPVPFRILAKKKYFAIPFLGWHLYRAGHLPVEPENARGSARNIVHAAQSAARGMSIVIFPEGTRSPDGKMHEFHSGAAYVAIKAGAPIVPMGIVGTWDALPRGSVIVRAVPVELRLGTPIATAGLISRDAGRLLAELRERIVELAGC